jgi:hypothetical protein
MSADILGLSSSSPTPSASLPTSSSSLSSSTAVDRAGWLELYQSENYTFDRFFFTLNASTLQYSKNENEEPIGSIPLEGSSVEIINEDKYGQQFCFEFNSPLEGRTYVFHALTAPDLNDWLNSIRRAMLRIRRDKAKLAAQNRRAQNANGSANSSSYNPDGNSSNSNNTHSNNNAYESSQSSNASAAALETRDKYDVYRQWLEETKEQKKSRGGRNHRRDASSSDSGSAHRQLLEYGEEEKPWYKKCCTIS